jgi:hypothetical protein
VTKKLAGADFGANPIKGKIKDISMVNPGSNDQRGLAE